MLGRFFLQTFFISFLTFGITATQSPWWWASRVVLPTLIIFGVVVGLARYRRSKLPQWASQTLYDIALFAGAVVAAPGLCGLLSVLVLGEHEGVPRENYGRLLLLLGVLIGWIIYRWGAIGLEKLPSDPTTLSDPLAPPSERPPRQPPDGRKDGGLS
jgi:hypothetical protein